MVRRIAMGLCAEALVLSASTRGAFVLDTTKPANDNIGHTFGAGLSAADRVALVAYLLTL